MIKIGITGQSGFIGTHLYNFLSLQKEVELVPFERSYFKSDKLLQDFVRQCNVIVHLAAMNRHSDQEVIYDTNINLVEILIDAIKAVHATPQVIFSSSTQEENDDLYGRSKKDGRELFARWANDNNVSFAGIVIPNVFGPFCTPFYNSVVATFCYQLTHNESPQIKTDKNLELLYVGELATEIWRIIKEKKNDSLLRIKGTYNIKVSEILYLLAEYKEKYFYNYVIPAFCNEFELNLFNTFRSYMISDQHFPVLLKKNTDVRGTFVEAVKTLTGGQFSFSNTHPGVARGNHFHTRKVERFIVISGRASIELRKIGTKEVLHFELDGRQPSFVDMPIWYTHKITNTGTDDLLTLFWINEFYDPQDPDTFYEDV